MGAIANLITPNDLMKSIDSPSGPVILDVRRAPAMAALWRPLNRWNPTVGYRPSSVAFTKSWGLSAGSARRV